MKYPDMKLWKKLPASFYQRSDVVLIAKELIGKILVTKFDGKITAGRIVETEAYNGIADMASHARNGRRTSRTEVMYAKGGVAYVYLCYGIHHLFNVVTNIEHTPHAILIRAVEPLIGIGYMLLRTFKKEAGYDITRGPGNLSKALGIHTHHTGLSLLDDEIYIADDDVTFDVKDILACPRIGVDYAGDDALLHYRFIVKGNCYVSGKKAGQSKQ